MPRLSTGMQIMQLTKLTEHFLFGLASQKGYKLILKYQQERLKYNINDRINLRAEPTFRYGLLNTDSKTYEYTHLWTAGLNISFNYGL